MSDHLTGDFEFNEIVTSSSGATSKSLGLEF